MLPRQQAGHMIAIDPPVGFLNLVLASKGPSTHVLGRAKPDPWAEDDTAGDDEERLV